MSDRLLRSREPKRMSGYKQPNSMTTLQGPSYNEPSGKSSNIWSANLPSKKSKSYVRG